MLFRYGIATPKGSRWRDPLSLAILEQQSKDIHHKFHKYLYILAMLFRYGITRTKGSRWRDPLSLAILEQQFKDIHHKFHNTCTSEQCCSGMVSPQPRDPSDRTRCLWSFWSSSSKTSIISSTNTCSSEQCCLCMGSPHPRVLVTGPAVSGHSGAAVQRHPS